MSDGLSAVVVHEADHDVLRLTGSLSLSTRLIAREAMAKLLADRSRLVVDLSELTLGWGPHRGDVPDRAGRGGRLARRAAGPVRRAPGAGLGTGDGAGA